MAYLPFFRNNTLTPEGIVQGNAPYLYGEKIKAYLQRGSRVLPGYEAVPNSVTGWGAVCLKDSFPE